MEPTKFLNVDLEIEGRGIDALARELDRRLVRLHGEVVRGKWFGSYELSSAGPDTVEKTLRGLLRVIERLPDDAKRAWSRATKRVFDVGLQAGREPHMSQYDVSAETVARVAGVGGRIVITVYAPFPRPRKRKKG